MISVKSVNKKKFLNSKIKIAKKITNSSNKNYPQLFFYTFSTFLYKQNRLINKLVSNV